MPALTLVVCGAPLARRTHDVAAALIADGWDTSVVGTPASAAWIDAEAVVAATDAPPRFDFRSPSSRKAGGPPDAVVVCPATFNTINKAALGIADTYALAVVCEALGMGTRLLIAPMVNNKLWGHPAWPSSLRTLRRSGVVMLDVQSGNQDLAAVKSGAGEDVVRRFNPAWLTTALKARF